MNPYYQTTARLANGDYLFHICQFRELEKNIEFAKRFVANPKWSSKGYYAIVRDPKGQLVFDSRVA